jgi:hypothetical protein
MRISRLLTLSVLLASLVACSVDGGGLRIALLANTEIQGDSIVLANLLPGTVSRRIREAAQTVSLGAAPQNGATRQFTREALTAAISSSGLSPADFVIPESVTIRRGSRLISLEEIYSAIQSSLAKNPVPGIPPFQLRDLTLNADVRVPSGDAGLQVTQISFDQFIGRARFRLWPRSAPGVLPFFATAKISSAVPASPSASKLLTIAAHSSVTLDSSASVLVLPGRPARLHLHSSNMDMLLQVFPLQRGYLGEVIRVRLAGTGRTMQARVAGDAYLDATL